MIAINARKVFFAKFSVHSGATDFRNESPTHAVKFSTHAVYMSGVSFDLCNPIAKHFARLRFHFFPDFVASTEFVFEKCTQVSATLLPSGFSFVLQLDKTLSYFLLTCKFQVSAIFWPSLFSPPKQCDKSETTNLVVLQLYYLRAQPQSPVSGMK